MGKIILNITMSLDGFIAPAGTAEGVFKSLPPGSGGPVNKSTDHFFRELFFDAGVILTDPGADFHRVPSLGHVPVLNLPVCGAGEEFSAGSLENLLEKACLQAGNSNTFIVTGAAIAKYCLQHRLPHLVQVRLEPVVMVEEGTRVFDHIGMDQLGFERALAGPGGVTWLWYRLVQGPLLYPLPARHLMAGLKP